MVLLSGVRAMGETGRLRNRPLLSQHHESNNITFQKGASEISTTFKEIKDECWSHHASEQFLKVLEEDTNPAQAPPKLAWGPQEAHVQ